MGTEPPGDRPTDAASDTDEAAVERAVRHALFSYCRGIDRLDGELISAAYHAGAVDDHGDAFRGPVEAYVPWVLGVLRDRFSATMHSLSNIRVERDGDVARVESHVLASHVVATTGALRVLGARYVDRFEHRPGAGWRIAHRQLVPEWQFECSGSVTVLPPGCAPSARDRSDPSYV